MKIRATFLATLAVMLLGACENRQSTSGTAPGGTEQAEPRGRMEEGDMGGAETGSVTTPPGGQEMGTPGAAPSDQPQAGQPGAQPGPQGDTPAGQ